MSKNNTEAIYPLSPMQQGMLFHTLYEPHSGVYFEQLNYALTGALDVAAFEQAWLRVVEWHPVLRTLFVWERLDKPLQVVRRRVKLPWQQLDWRGLTSFEQQERLAAFLAADQAQGFNLSQAPLMRVAVIQMAENAYQCIWSYHHLLLDKEGQNFVLDDVLTCYEAFRRGQDPRLEQRHPYRDYIAWLQKQDLSKAEVFWRQTLAGFTTPTPLPADRGSSTLSDHKISTDESYIRLSKETTSALQTLTRQQQLTLNTVIQGAWALLLNRYSGEEDVVFGASVSGRPGDLMGAESMIGLFINTLPVRARVSPTASLLSWLKELQDQQIEARQYDYSPLVEVQKWSDVPRGQSLFESILVFMNYQMGDSLQEQEHSLKIKDESGVEKTNYPLTFVAVPEPEMILVIRYNRHRFDPSAITRMLGHLRMLLEGMVAHPTQKLSSLPLLTPEERQLMLLDWNNTTAAFPQDQCLHELFEAQVKRTPGALAAICEHQTLTYEQLNQQANQLAHYLQRLGVGPEVLVGLCVERSLEMIVGLLGIVKAGGAYVPLDPAYPKERLSFMLTDAHVPVLLTQRRLLESLPACQARIICLDSETDQAAITHESRQNPESGVTPENLVYMIYSSGSTGRPKGILLNHRGRVNNFTDFNRRFAIGSQDRLFALSSPSFDMAAYDVFGTLSAGGAIVLPTAALERNPIHWAELMVRHRVTLWHSVPALLQLLVEYISGRSELVPHSLRLALLGGDWIPVTLPDHLHALVADVHVISMGGATEASMDSTIFAIEERDPNWRSIPYGRPMANQRCYVLDAHLNPVPIGVVGELHLAGIGLARGYLNCPDLAAQKFIPSPFNEVPGDRLYKTGDLVRYGPDGNLELLGRIDYQVKIRGVRIELGEIEAALRKEPEVQEVLVIAREDEPGHKRLVAYIVPFQNQPLDKDEIRSHLKDRLPESMVPSAFVVLDALPLTPNGKVDRRNLPAPAMANLQQNREIILPTTPVEKILVSIWKQVLGIEEISIHDDFFLLGGDSIISIQVTAKAHESGLQLTPKQVFQHQTIAELATVADITPPLQDQQEQVKSVDTPYTSLKQVDVQKLNGMFKGNSQIEDMYPLTPMQHTMLSQVLDTPISGLNVIQSSMPMPRNLNIPAWERAWQMVVDRHAILRTSFVREGFEKPIQVVHTNVKITVEHHDWRGLPPVEQQEQLEIFLQDERTCGFDLAKAPLLRFALIQVGEDAYQFTMVYSYMILDGWSRLLLWKEVFALYEAFCNGHDANLEPTRPYRDYITWLGQQDQSKAEAFWRKTLKGYTTPTHLSIGRASGDVLSAEDYVRQAAWLEEATTTALRSLVQQQQLTLNTLVQGVWILLLSLYSDEQDVVYGVTSSGRPADLIGVESMIGSFINTLPLRTQVLSEAWLLPWLKDLQVQMLELRQYEYSSLLHIHEWSAIPQEKPLFESILVFENYPVDAALYEQAKNRNTSHSLAQLDLNIAQTNYPLRIEVFPGKTLSLSMAYYRSYFDDNTIALCLDHFQQLLRAIVANPGQRLKNLLSMIELSILRS